MNITPTLIIIFISFFFYVESTNHPFEEDFVQTFFAKTEKLKETKRLNSAGPDWVEKSAYQDAVGISIENWTNQKLEFPDHTISEGGIDRWYKPVAVERHYKDIVMFAVGTRGGESKGSVSFLIEDSWPRTWISLGWRHYRSHLDVVLGFGKAHLSYNDLKSQEHTALSMTNKMRFYKATDKFIMSVSCSEEGSNKLLQWSVIPQNMDVWAWEKYYKKELITYENSATVQKVDFITTAQPSSRRHEVVMETGEGNIENDPGVFERKELLIPGGSVRLQGNKTEKELLARMDQSVAVAIRLENWSKYKLSRSAVNLQYGEEAEEFPVVDVGPGHVELFLVRQDGGVTGVSGVFHWKLTNPSNSGIGNDHSPTVMSFMISVPFNPHLYSTWTAMGLTKSGMVPDFTAMYYGTPDSSWFIREKTGRRMEFSDGELILVMDTDSGTSKPVVRLALVPRDPDLGAETVKRGLETGIPASKLYTSDGTPGREGTHSMVSALSSSAQCHCPCMGATSHSSCISRSIILLGLFFQLHVLITFL